MKRYKKVSLLLVLLSCVINVIVFCYNDYSAGHFMNKFTHQIAEVYENIEELGSKYIYVDDSLVYWQDNTVPVSEHSEELPVLAELSNGVYLHKSVKDKDTVIHYYYPVKYHYNPSSRYLENKFNYPFKVSDDADVVFYKTELPIVYNNTTVGYVEASEECMEVTGSKLFVLRLWFVFNLFLLILCVVRIVHIEIKNKSLKVIIMVACFVIYTLAVVIPTCRYKNDISLQLLSDSENYINTLLFAVVILLGYILYVLSSKILGAENKNRWYLVKKMAIIWIIAIIGGGVFAFYAIEGMHQRMENKASELINSNTDNDSKNFNILMSASLQDTTVRNYIAAKDYDKAEEYINTSYLSLLRDANHTNILIYTGQDSMLIHPNNKYTEIHEYVKNRLAGADKVKPYECLFAENGNEAGFTYIYYKEYEDVYLFAECLKKEKSKNMNYSLLLDTVNDIYDMAYAKYVNNTLVYSNGDITFDNVTEVKDKQWAGSGNYTTYYAKDNNIIYAISSKRISGYNIISGISIFCLILTVMAAFEHVLRYIFFNKRIVVNIKDKIMMSLLGTLVVGFSVFGFFSIRSIISLNNGNNQSILKEKTVSLQREIEKIINSDVKFWEDKLFDLSNMFLTDINIFNQDGRLFATSQPEIYDKGIISDRMNTVVLEKLQKSDADIFYRQEEIGTSRFISSYCVIKSDDSGEQLYLNIPFIYQQEIMRANINGLINDFANMSLFWVNIAVVIFLLLSSVITSPLEMLKEKMGSVDINLKNNQIEWHKHDEIGQLIKSYNLMIDKINESTLLLKEQERLSSWRELARQVAHDIKNPLTPMKLSIQYLQRLYAEKPDLFDIKWKEISPSLIAQIESISTITQELNSYSNPGLSKQKVNLTECIKDAINLFNVSEDIEIIYNVSKDCFVLGDEKLFIRIFNNFIKNAVQALYNRDDGIIQIDIMDKENKYIVSVRDNGCGIKAENLGKIFNTHFTTKSDGGGIGLSIVKSILENYNAKVEFESKENVGTVFFITFDMYNKDNE